MMIIIILGVVVLLAVGIVGFLFYLLRKETTESVAVVNFSEIKKTSPISYGTEAEKSVEIPVTPANDSKESPEIVLNWNQTLIRLGGIF